MEENEGTQICPNCNRDIPKVNFVTHSVHCVRNIKICPVCKEPVLQSALDKHNEKLHELVPCRQCGEMVRGTDMEDHTRDSCAFTMQSCRYCSLELKRREVPAHERYCGARTELCADCGEYVMMRYRQLHLESNHGFVRLREDSPPRPAIRVVDDSTQNHVPATSRPKFPPYVPLTDLVGPNTNREESLRLIAEFRARQAEREDEYTSKFSDEELRFKFLAAVPLRIPGAEEPGHDDDGFNRMRLREQIIANLRARVNAREQPRFNEEEEEEEENDVEMNVRGLNEEEFEFDDIPLPRNRARRRPFRDSVIVRNAVRPCAPGRSVVALNLPARNAAVSYAEGRYAAIRRMVQEVEVPNAVARDAAIRRMLRHGEVPNTEPRNAAIRRMLQRVEVPNAEERDAIIRRIIQGVEVPNAEARDAAIRRMVVQDVGMPNAEARDAAVPNRDAQDVGPLNAEARHATVPNTDAQDVESPNAETREVAVPNTDARDASAQNAEARDAGAPIAEAHDAGATIAEARDAAASNTVMIDVATANLMTGDTESQDATAEISDAREIFAAAKIAEEADTTEEAEVIWSPSSNYRLIFKRSNDQPQINTAVTAQDKVVKKLGTRGPVKKRPAPAAPVSPKASSTATSPAVPAAGALPPIPDPRRDLAYYSALRRRQAEDLRRLEQTAYNMSIGLPPVLDPAAKLEKLRKMDALHNRQDEPPDYRRRLHSRVWSDNNNAHAGHTLGYGPSNTNANNTRIEPMPQSADVERQRRELLDVQPMSPEQFMERFNELQLIKEPRDIRSSLRELRRGLNEVTAPYNNAGHNNNDNNNKKTNKNNNIIERENKILRNAGVPDPDQLDEARGPSPEEDVMVPCEFCCEPLRAVHILDHERACRLGLSRARGLAATPTPPATPSPSSRPESPWDNDNIPVIPCEFCTVTLPFYLIIEHQELCGRESQLLYPD